MGALKEGDPFAVVDEEGIEVAGMEVFAFPTPHDSLESLGYRIHTPDGRRIGVATDIGFFAPVIQQAAARL